MKMLEINERITSPLHKKLRSEFPDYLLMRTYDYYDSTNIRFSEFAIRKELNETFR